MSHFMTVGAQSVTHFDLLSSEELHSALFDSNGLLWLGTSGGVRTFDGTTVRPCFIRQARRLPQLAGDIRCMAEDRCGFMWLGTNDGLVRIKLSTGEPHLYRFPKKSQQVIYALHVAKDGTVYAGTDDGFSVYDGAKDSFTHHNVDNAKAVNAAGKTVDFRGYGVKDFAETASGDILIGTWGQGLWRYFPRRKSIRAYEKVNDANSAYALHVDKGGKLWIGSQGYGVLRLDNVDDYRLKSLSANGKWSRHDKPVVVYDIAEDKDGHIEACTGDTIIAITDADGTLWKLTRDGGADVMRHTGTQFRSFLSEGVRSVYTDDGRGFYIGYGMRGLAWYDAENGCLRQNNLVPGFDAIPEVGFITRITSIVRRRNGDLLAAAGDNGLLVARGDGNSEVLYANSRQMPYVRDNVTALYEAEGDGTLWIGQRQGLSVLLSDGTAYHLDVKTDSVDLTGYLMVNHITGDQKGRIWVSSVNKGVFMLSGNPAVKKSLNVRRYAMPTAGATACFEDSRHWLWAIGDFGLLRYDEAKDCFSQVEGLAHAVTEKVLSINEDSFGALWIATGRALIRICFGSDGRTTTMCYTCQNGLPNVSFLPNSTFKYGDKLYFGTRRGVVEFSPSSSISDGQRRDAKLVVSDIWLDGTSAYDMDSTAYAAVAESQPMYAKTFVIQPSVKKFSIYFSLLNYLNQDETRYAYMLEEYDDDWRYVDSASRGATFENVPPGTYRLKVRAIDSQGNDYYLPETLTIKVLPPWYATWWAFVLYLVILGAVSWLVWNYIMMRQEMKASRRLSTMLQCQQMDETKLSVGLTDTVDAPDAVSENVDSRSYRHKDAEFMDRAMRLVRDNLDDSTYNRDRMAADLGMSVSTLYTRLRNVTGLSIQTYIQTIRLNMACDILRKEPDIRISELAYRVGFNTPKYFSQCFKKEFGILPGEYLDKLGEGEGLDSGKSGNTVPES